MGNVLRGELDRNPLVSMLDLEDSQFGSNEVAKFVKYNRQAYLEFDISLLTVPNSITSNYKQMKMRERRAELATRQLNEER